jgi:hypothetical protein
LFAAQHFMTRAKETDMPMTIAGPIDSTAPLAPRSAYVVPNAVGTQFYGGQWRLSNGGKYMYDLDICSNAAAPAVTLRTS